MEKKYIIYRIWNLKTRKFYIGKTSQSLAARWKTHKSDGKHGNKYSKYRGVSYLYKSMRKYGIENFEIKQIDLANNYLHGCFLEQFYIKYYQSINNKYGYNLVLENSKEIKYHTNEIREKIRLKTYKRMALEKKTGISFDKKTKKWALNFEYENIKISKLFLDKIEAEFKKDILSLFFYKEYAILIHPENKNYYNKIDLKEEIFNLLKNKHKNKYNYIFKNKLKYTVVFSIKEGGKPKNKYFGTYEDEKFAAIIADKINYYLYRETKKNKFNLPELVDETYLLSGKSIYNQFCNKNNLLHQ